MSFRLNREQATRIADLLGPVVKKPRLDGTPVPVRMHAALGGLEVMAVPDLPRVTAVSAHLDGIEVESECVYTLAGTRLVEICRRIRDEVQVTGDEVLVHIGHWQTPVVEEPTCPEVGGEVLQGSAQEFIKALSTVSWAISADMVRPRLTLARMHNGYFRASDGLRYCEARVDFEGTWEVSGFVVNMLRRYFEGVETPLELRQSEQYQRYRSGPVNVYCPRPYVEHLDLDALVAQPARAHNHFVLKVRRDEILQAVRDAAIMSDDTSIVTWQIHPDRIIVSAEEGLNRAEVNVPCAWTSEPRELRFFLTPLLQFLRVVETETLEMRLGTSTLRKLTPLVVWEDGIFALVNQVRSGG